MSDTVSGRLDQVLDDYRRSRERLRELQDRIAKLSVSVTAARTVVTVTAGPHGEITGMRFPSAAYRGLAPAELASIVLETVRAAQSRAREELAALVAPMLPAGSAVGDLLAGRADVDAVLPEQPPEPGLFLLHDGDVRFDHG